MEPKKLVEFFMEVGKLKKLKRSGWLVTGVKNPESVAEHSFRTALMTLILGSGRKEIDLNKAIKMALIHDIAECKIGDIITWKNFHMSREKKLKMERKAMKEMVSMLHEHGDGYMKLWEEFEKGETEEAKFVKQVDVLEMILQALEYDLTEDKENIRKDFMESFFEDGEKSIKDRELRKILKEIISLR